VLAASSCLGVTLDLEPVSFRGSTFSFPSSTFAFGPAAAFAGQTKGAGCLPSVSKPSHNTIQSSDKDAEERNPETAVMSAMHLKNTKLIWFN
jgi:hypothetical protein